MSRPLFAAMLALALGACDKSPTIPNAAPSVAGIDAIVCLDGVCDVAIRLVDADADPVDLDVACVRASGDCTLTDAPGTDGRSGLDPDRAAPGRSHLLRLAIAGPGPTEKINLRLTPTDARELTGEPYTSPGFTLAAGL